MEKNVLIINYNTTLLTQCCIKSVNKTTPGCKIYVFDNSDKTPFDNIFDNVEVIDNTKEQIINWKEWENKYVSKKSTLGSHNGYASAKHCFSVQKCMDIIKDNFVLLDSDVLVKKDFSDLFDNSKIFISEIQAQRYNPEIKRVLPYICWINVKSCAAKNISFFNEEYMHGLGHGYGDSWDTGSWFYHESKNEDYGTIRYSDYILHLKAGSWKSVNIEKWLAENKNLWSE